MGKYDPLKLHLQSKKDLPEITMDFAEIETVLGMRLPSSALKHRSWWSNELSGSHSHCRSWMDAGYGVYHVDFANGRVVFRLGIVRTTDIYIPRHHA